MNDWTFKNFSTSFDSHVREQLPWYELVTESVSYIARNYIPKNGHVYDIGASTGNITQSLQPVITERNATITAIEENYEMCNAYSKNEFQNNEIFCQDAIRFEYKNFDVAIVFLTAMFFPAKEQEKFINNLISKMNIGGAIILVDKCCNEDGYFGTVMKRLTMYWKLKNGAKAEDIISKELSLSGVQIPINYEILKRCKAKQFFQMGEFKGWVIEK